MFERAWYGARYACNVVKFLWYQESIEAGTERSKLPDLLEKAIKAGQRALELSDIANGLPIAGVIERKLDGLYLIKARYVTR